MSYELPTDRSYEPETHLWVRVESDDRVRCGFDPLGAETCGDLVALSIEPVGSVVERGKAFGSLEAAKFVGPMLAPVAGRITAHNERVLADPSLVNEEPLTEWLVEIEPADPASALDGLISDPDVLSEWIKDEVEKFKRQGMIAE